MVCLWACSSVWLERSADNRKVESSNLSRPTFQFTRSTLIIFLVVICVFERALFRWVWCRRIRIRSLLAVVLLRYLWSLLSCSRRL
jgi:hypothetical protein